MKLNLPKVDSLRLLIPKDEVRINPNHPEFTRHLTTTNEDGEIVKEATNNTYRLHENPCSCHYLNATTIIQGKAVEVIKLGFSSKTLKDKYFDGITLENLPTIYQFILDEGVISLSYESLLNAKVVDTDICTDIILTASTVQEIVTVAYQLSDKHKGTAVNHFKQDTNTGIEWGHRNKVGKAYKTKQYLKFYAKALELKYKSKVFYDAYIKGTPVEKHLVNDKLIRIETTIKNNAHWLTYGTTVQTLQDLLKLNLSQYPDIYNRPINHYVLDKKLIPKKVELAGKDKLMLAGVCEISRLGNLTILESAERLLKLADLTDKVEKYRQTKYLRELISNNREEILNHFNEHTLEILEEMEMIKMVLNSSS